MRAPEITLPKVFLMGNLPGVHSRAPIHVFASPKSWIEGAAIRQLEEVASLAGIDAVAAMPDLHPGKFGPVGCAILADHLHPRLVGNDIGCGMALFRLDIEARKLKLDRMADRLIALDEPLGEASLQAARAADLPSTPFDDALGSIGGGNHFCELQAIEEIIAPDIAIAHGIERGAAFVLVHSGSRGLGNAVLETTVAAGDTKLDPSSEAGRAYLARHDHAVHWARLNRHLIARRAAEAARADVELMADLPHNLVEMVGTLGAPSALHRKGAAAADRGLVPVPGSRGTLSYLVAPVAPYPAAALASLAHGAGRKYDRASMHGRVRTKRSDLEELRRNGLGGVVICEDRDLLVEEAPIAYKPIGRVIDDLVSFGLVRVVATFRPLVTFKKGSASRRPARRLPAWKEAR